MIFSIIIIMFFSISTIILKNCFKETLKEILCYIELKILLKNLYYVLWDLLKDFIRAFLAIMCNLSICTVLLLTIYLMYVNVSDHDNKYEKLYDIGSLEQLNEKNNKFVLKSDSEYYIFYTKTLDNEYKLERMMISDTSIKKESIDTPYVDKVIYIYKENWFMPEIKHNSNKYIIHIPENSIIEQKENKK